MTWGATIVLGLIAGGTILLGMPVGRIKSAAPSMRLFLNALAVGILIFIAWDVLAHAWEPIDESLASFHESGEGLIAAIGYGLLFVLGLSVGLLSLVFYEQWMARTVKADQLSPGPGSMAAQTTTHRHLAHWSPARRLALMIAVGIGLHNFAEGLAIGQSAAAGEIGLAVVLVVGFALHNATEGFGIVAPLGGDVDEDGNRRIPSWGFLLMLAAIGGGPTLVGTIVGRVFVNEAVSVVFLTLAAGSILYVVIQLIGMGAKQKRMDILAYGILLGLIAGFVTDAIVTAGGA